MMILYVMSFKKKDYPLFDDILLGGCFLRGRLKKEILQKRPVKMI